MSALAQTVLSLQPHTGIEFGLGAVERLPDAVVSASPGPAPRAFVVTDRGLRAAGIVDRVVALLRGAGVATAVYDGVPPNPSTASVDEAAAVVRHHGDCVVVALGGGSSLDAAKGIALLATNPGASRDFQGTATPDLPGLPVVAVPTTAGTGAETNGFGVLEDCAARRKVYVGHASVRPRMSVLDPELTVGLPPGPTAATGMDALVHGIESLASRRSSPVSAAYATEAVRLVGGSLAAAVAEGSDLEARAQLLLGSHLAGLALSASGLGLVHGIAHAVTTHTGAVHGLALTAVLDDVMGRSLDVSVPAYARVAEAMGARAPTADPHAAATVAIAAVRRLADDVRARLQLRELGVEEHMVPAVATAALADAVSANHPRAFSHAEVEDVLVATR